MSWLLLRFSSQRLTDREEQCTALYMRIRSLLSKYLGRVLLAFLAAKPRRVRVCDEQRQPACVGASELAVVPQQLALVSVEQRVGVAVVPARAVPIVRLTIHRTVGTLEQTAHRSCSDCPLRLSILGWRHWDALGWCGRTKDYAPQAAAV